MKQILVTSLLGLFCIGSLASDAPQDGVLRVNGHPFIRRAGFGAATTFRKDYLLRLDEKEVGGERDIYTQSGLNTVMYDFNVEKDGAYDFAALDDFLKRAEKANLKVVFHIPQSIPRWLAEKRDWHWIGADGSKIPMKGYPHHNPAEYAAALKYLWQPLFDHIRNNPRVIGYQISGEHHPYDSVTSKVSISYDEFTLEKYRAFLKAKYSLKEVSMRYCGKDDFYPSFDEVYPLAIGNNDFKGRALKNPTVARWDWYRFKKLASVDCWVAMAKTFQQMDGRNRSLNYEYNHGPYSDCRFFPLHAAAAQAPGFGLGNGDFDDSLTELFLYSGFVKTIGGAAWINNELESGWTGSFKNDPTSVDAAYMRRHIWGNLAMGSQGYNLWTFPNLAGYTPDNPKKLAESMADPQFGRDLPMKYWEVKHANRLIDSLGDLLAQSTAPAPDIGVLMLDDANFNFMFVESYNVDVFGVARALTARGLIDRAGIYTEYHLDSPSFDLNRLKAIVLPRSPRLTEAHMAKLADYVKNGGTLFLMGEVARVGEMFNEYASFPAGALAEACGIKARKLTAEDLRGAAMDSMMADGIPIRLNARTAIEEPLPANVTVLARTGEKPSITVHAYGKGRCYYLTGEPITVDDADRTADVVSRLLAEAGCNAAATLREGAQPAAGVFVARRVGPKGTLLFLIETGDRRHQLSVSLQPELLGLDVKQDYRVFECFSGGAWSVSQANQWTLPFELEPAGVRCLLVTPEVSRNAVLPKAERIDVPRAARLPLLSKGPWSKTANAQRPYFTDDLIREHRERMVAESAKATVALVQWKELGQGFSGLDLDGIGNERTEKLISNIDLNSAVSTDPKAAGPCPLGSGTVKLGEVPALTSSKVLRVGRELHDVPVHARLASLHFFHGGRFSEHDSLIGYYRVRYADGTAEQVPVVVQASIGDFIRPAMRMGRYVTVWKGMDKAKTRFQLYRMDWTNPHPEKVVASVDLVNITETKSRSWEVWAITMHVAEMPSLHIAEPPKGVDDKTEAAGVPSWGLGPFVRCPENPLITPRSDTKFSCPLEKKDVAWESRDIVGAAAAVKDGKVYWLYRAEPQVMGHSRVGLAISEDGIHFKRNPTPVIYPDEDAFKKYEWPGGTEDGRIVMREDGLYLYFYPAYNGNGHDWQSVATSRDLMHWTKQGPIYDLDPKTGFSVVQTNGAEKGLSVVSRYYDDGRVVAEKINGKYWGYLIGKIAINVANSDDCLHWTVVLDAQGKPNTVLPSRSGGGKFDCNLIEPGPPPIITPKGILVLYHGGENDPKMGDPNLPKRSYSGGQALFELNDPTKMIARCDNYFLTPRMPYELNSSAGAPVCFMEGLVRFKGKWLLYYEAGDYVGCMASCDRTGFESGTNSHAAEPVDLVNPLIGTAPGHGKVFPGAAMPFGLVQLSPDTITGGDNGSGYRYDNDSIEGFSFTHMSGIGWYGDLGNLSIMPTTGPLKTDCGLKRGEGWRSGFSHANETAQPGYYAVTLADYQIRTELTATPHAGILRFNFPQHEQARIQIDLARRVGGTAVRQFYRVVDERHIEGWMLCTPEGGGWGNGDGRPDYTVYFFGEFSRPLDKFGAWSAEFPEDYKPKVGEVGTQKFHQLCAEAKVLPGCRELEGRHLGFYSEFAARAGEPVLFKAGISFVSLEGARRNLAAEIPGWDFDAVRAQARQAWATALDKVKIEGGAEVQRRAFYTALYHTMIDPRAFADCDGAYPGGDKKPHKTDRYTRRTIFSGWDVFRSQYPLLTIVNPAIVHDSINLWIDLAAENGKGYFDRWEFLNAYSGCMVGNPAVSVLLDAYAKGIRDYDVERAYAAARATCEKFGNGELGYSPGDLSSTMEYAYSDWCLSQLAAAFGKKADAEIYGRRARNWRNVFDPRVGWFHPRDKQGKWFAWTAKERLETRGSVESNYGQQGFFVPHDIGGLAEQLGGSEKLVSQLNSLFEQTKNTRAWNDYYNHANEVVHLAPFLFNRAGAPWLTQKWVRHICAQAYGDRPDGIAGDEDVGQMSAWFILCAAGLHPACPGEPRYELFTPLFDRVEFRLDPHYAKGRKFTVIACNNKPENIYIQSAKLNGRPLDRCWITHEELTAGGELELELGPQPNKAWGVAAVQAQSSDWMVGPFARPNSAEPVIRPNPASVFDCPMRKKPVHWEATHTFNPAAVVKDGKVYLLYRAEDNSGAGIGGYISRLGLASSENGIHFTKLPAPVLYPGEDAHKELDWEGGCEDPRVVETEDGTYVLFYTQYCRKPRSITLGMATSKDLMHWTKCGTVQGHDANGKMVTPIKSASLVTAVKKDRLIAAKIDGKYWLYYGEGVIRLLSSPDLKTWTPVPNFRMAQRGGKYDSALAECGPPALLTDKGIVLLYNGKNGGKGDPNLPNGVYAAGQALFDAKDPTKLLDRSEQPFFKPEMDWEKTGQYAAGTTFIEGLVLFHGKWFLYYGCADTFVGVAMADPKPGEIQFAH